MKRNTAIAGLAVVLACGIVAYGALRNGSLRKRHGDKTELVSGAETVATGATGGTPSLPDRSAVRNVFETMASPHKVAKASSFPLPRENTPWKEEYAALWERSQSGDAQAASRLFRDTLRCKNYQTIPKRVNYMLSMYTGTKASESILRNYDKQLEALRNELSSASLLCKDADPQELASVIYPVVEQAAALGDPMAGTCYADGSLFQKNDSTSDQIDIIKEKYKQHALQFANAGIESGNWVMVALMILAYGDTPPEYGGRGWLGDLVQPDPLTMYSFMLLQRAGMSSTAAARMDQTLSSISEANRFSAHEIAAAKNWAGSVYASYFAGHPYPVGESVAICALE